MAVRPVPVIGEEESRLPSYPPAHFESAGVNDHTLQLGTPASPPTTTTAAETGVAAAAMPSAAAVNANFKTRRITNSLPLPLKGSPSRIVTAPLTCGRVNDGEAIPD